MADVVVHPDGSQEEELVRRSAFSRGCSSLDAWLQNTSQAILNHFLWISLIVISTILLLIGPPVQIFMPCTAKQTMDILYFLGFFIFVIDMIFHCYLDPRYFPWGPCHIINRSELRKSYLQNSLGSFSFWCDFLSTICFLSEISFLGLGLGLRHDLKTETIILQNLGFPTTQDFSSAMKNFNGYIKRSNVPSIILILKTARVARLAPATTVVNLSAKLNLYWYLMRLTPCFCWRAYLKRREDSNRVNKELKVTNNLSKKRPSWGATRAYIQATSEREKKMKEKGKIVYVRYKLGKWLEYTLRFLRILPNTNIELNRQIAATRIQRVWRNRHIEYMELRSEKGDGSQAWSAHDAGTTLRVTNLSESNHESKAELLNDQNNDGNRRILRKRRDKKGDPSQIGSKMSEITGQRVAIFLLFSLLLVLIFTYTENNSTNASTMVLLHGQTTSTDQNLLAFRAVDTARRSTIPLLYYYTYTSSKYNTNLEFSFEENADVCEWEKQNITVTNKHGTSTGLFSRQEKIHQNAKVELILLLFFLLIWFFGVAAFAGPITSLVIKPIERAVELLSQLVTDPLGYRNTLHYKTFCLEADQNASKGRWSREVLKGMETEFLMSTIDRIGSLMKVGFGSAGVQIIRNNLQKGQSKDTLEFNSQGSIVSCIFLFCDIRGFTDATECLQEEVFVFTNRVAAVVHSICNSYAGSANKNIGDAFLVSWKLDNDSARTQHQADKALLSVVKICIALHHDYYYVKTMTDHARSALINKLKDRPGPTVQLGFGLHAGKAVEGAIGSNRKIDATYVAEAVETSEYLETSTKKYKTLMMMSDSFHRLLTLTSRRRCRKIDQITFDTEDDEFHEEDICNQGNLMELFTYDIDVDALWDDTRIDDDGENRLSDSDDSAEISSSKRGKMDSNLLKHWGSEKIGTSTRNSTDGTRSGSLDSQGDNQNMMAIAAAAAKALRNGPISDHTKATEHGASDTQGSKKSRKKPELVLPTGPALYSENIWLQADMRRIRRRYTTDWFSTFKSGLQKYYAKDWSEAKSCFEAILDRFEDGPSNYFLGEMKKYNGVPPPDFKAFGKG